MSWYGCHPVITKAQAKTIIHPRACKLCVYWVRIRIKEGHHTHICSYCGTKICIPDIRQLFEQRYGPDGYYEPKVQPPAQTEPSMPSKEEQARLGIIEKLLRHRRLGKEENG